MTLLDRIVSDFRLVKTYAGLAMALRKARPGSSYTFLDAYEESLGRHRGRPAIRFEGREMSYGEVDAYANRVARWARGQGFERGDVVALLAPNRLEYLPIWIGLGKVGVVAALINTNLTGRSLVHCVSVARARTAIVDPELAPALDEVRGELDGMGVWELDGGDARGEDFDAALAEVGDAPIGAEAREGIHAEDALMYIYTSGTTGLPKAAKISHQRALAASHGARAAQELGPRDVMYDCLPLYHSAGGLAAAGASLLGGSTLAVSRKFSASRFIDECRETGATTFQYIGELCRYLLNSPERPREREHDLRMCIGNGMRPEVWEPFQQRFGIPRVLEFYGATEGNVSFINLDGKPGTVGRVPAFARKAMGLHVVRFDVEREEVVRDAQGHCIECGPGEAGEVIARINELTRFDGYTDEQATKKKVLTDVFRPGDRYFRTGDLLRFDEEGYFYFVDRIGDTFRWKGENVSTNEVAEVLSSCPGVSEVNVYGVEVHGCDGRAGMASLVTTDAFDLEAIGRHVERELPAYARPLFLRLQPEMETTGTFKHRKVQLVKGGFDPDQVADPLFFHDGEKGYVPLEPDLYARIQAGEVRV
ncbi:MAG: long-chain-acyl-CoA synthetase [Myxococcota bacterium]|nr:long-chain-acyl-CoA synthetase [Myxococcota bacterium]